MFKRDSISLALEASHQPHHVPPEEHAPAWWDIGSLIGLEELGERLNQQLDVADGLTGLQNVCATIESMSPQHLALVEAALALANAGTPMRTSDMVPALESYVGQKISTEGLGERVMAIIKSVLAALQRYWQAVVDFVTGYKNDVGQLKYQLEMVQTQITQVEGASPKREKVTFTPYIYGMLTTRALPDNVRPVLIGLAELRRQVQVIRQHHVPVAESVAKSALAAIVPPSSHPEETQRWLHNLNQIAATYNITKVESAIGALYPLNDGTHPKGTARAAPTLPGLRQLVLVDGAKLYPDKVEGNDRERAIMLQASAVKLAKLQSNSHDDSRLSMNTLSSDHLKEVSDAIAALIAESDAGAALVEEISALSRKLGESVGKWTNQESASAEDLQVGLRYATTFATRLTQPYLQLLELSAYVSQVALSYCRSHLAAYR